jgi:hypothetical protein
MTAIVSAQPKPTCWLENSILFQIERLYGLLNRAADRGSMIRYSRGFPLLAE